MGLEVDIVRIKDAFSRVVPIELDEMASRQYVEFIGLFRVLYFNGEMMEQIEWMMKQEADNAAK